MGNFELFDFELPDFELWKIQINGGTFKSDILSFYMNGQRCLRGNSMLKNALKKNNLLVNFELLDFNLSDFEQLDLHLNNCELWQNCAMGF